jgi:hypothetical protein
MRALWLADVLRGAGLEVVETAGWQTRGRDFAADPLGIMAHHTASPIASTLATNLHVVTNGNSVAPGPIAQAMLWRDGVWYIIAAGRANHAGKGSLPWLPGADTGNQHLLSVEAVNNGVGELWAPAMVISYEIGTAAILRRLGHGAERATTHAEYAPSRKIDPAGPTGGRIATLPGRATWDPNAWRAAVGKWLTPAPPVEIPDPPAPPTEEADDMPVLHLITPTLGEWLWTPGGEPQPLKSVSDGVAILGAVKATRVQVSDAQLVALQHERPPANVA